MRTPKVPQVSEPGEISAVEFNIWRSSRFPGLEVIETNSHDHSYPAHLHDTLEVVWIRAGGVRVLCPDGTFDITEGQAAIIPPNELHAGGVTGSILKYVAILLPRALVDPIFPDFSFVSDDSGKRTPIKVVSREKAESLMPILIRTLCADLTADRLIYILRPILCQMFGVPLDGLGFGERRDVHPAVSKAQSMIRDQCADRMQISQLARNVDLDMRYLISLFKLATGVTPHQFQIAMRVELARALLEEHLPLCEVAARAGFADQSHLNRHFRRQYGFTPGAFRESVVMSPNLIV